MSSLGVSVRSWGQKAHLGSTRRSFNSTSVSAVCIALSVFKQCCCGSMWVGSMRVRMTRDQHQVAVSLTLNVWGHLGA
jgi:hypothetical protein